MKRWSEKDLENLKNKGFKVVEMQPPPPSPFIMPTSKIKKISVEKNTIQLILETMKKDREFDEFVTELRFHPVRRFRFDWAIPSLKIAIEYEGVYSAKSRHTTVDGFSTDCEKYNLATGLGWRVLRYTANNYKQVEDDLKKLTKALEN